MSAMSDTYTAICEAVDAEGGPVVASTVYGLLQELPVNIHDGASLALLSDALEMYLGYDDEQPARYMCKMCGAESPAGIGYAAQTPGPLPSPAPGCPNLHTVGGV